MAAAGDHGAAGAPVGNTHEHGLHADCAEPQAHFIILGQAGAGKWTSVVPRGDPRQSNAFDRAADAGHRDRRADRFANHQLLHVRFGEFVGIMTANPARVRIDEWDHRQLDQPGIFDQPVEQLELKRMNDILGVVQHDCLGGAADGFFIGDQRSIEPVEAISFGGWAVGVDLNRDDARVADAVDCGEGRRVIAVIADEQPIFVMIEPLQRGSQHRRDHRCFVPGGDQHRHPSRPHWRWQLARMHPRETRVDRHFAPASAGEVNKVDRKIVDREQQKPGRGEQRQLGGQLGQDQRDKRHQRLVTSIMD